MSPGRRPLVAANWKMHQGLATARRFATDLAARAVASGGPEVWLAPAFVHVAAMAEAVSGSTILVAGQDCHWEAKGAYTGEVSAAMLKDAGARAVVLGHSERRLHRGESDALVARKLAAAVVAGLTPLVCVGESLAEREAGRTIDVVGRQLAGATHDVAGLGLPPGGLVVAYEPVWAIGSGRAATPGDAQAVTSFLRSEIRGRLGPAWAEATRILYGGSITAANAKQIFAEADVDGGLVGGASLDLAQFVEIIRAAG